MHNPESSPDDIRDADNLFAYVDRLVDGQPAIPTTNLERTAQRIHAAAGPGLNAALPHTRRTDLWSDIMHTMPQSTAPATTPGHRIAERWTPPRWNAVANGALAAALVLALVAGFWRFGDLPGTGNGSGDDNDGAQFAAQTGEATAEVGAPGDTPDAADPRPTAELTDEPAITMPTAADCTVDPLTVGEVLAIVDSPEAASRAPIYMVEDAYGFGVDQTRTFVANEPPPQKTMNEIATSHFLYMACAMTGDWFRVWALSDPSLVYRDVVEGLYPTYITRQDARILLEELLKEGRAGGLPYLAEHLGGFDYSEMVNNDPASSKAVAILDDGTPVDVMVGTAGYTADGRKIKDSERSISSEHAANPVIAYLQYVWSFEQERWLLFEGPQHVSYGSG